MMVAWRNTAILLILLLSSGCVSTQTESFLIVRAGIKDTPEDLAERHLGDRDKAWLIREVNEIDALSPGQQVVIPTREMDRGGLHAEGVQKVPILVYHGFSSAPAKTRTIISRDKFVKQMQYLRDNDYHVVSMDDFFDFLEFKKDLPPRSIVLNFDDGWCSLYEIAFPVLKEYGYQGTLFLYTDLIHENTCLSWDQVREIQQSGFIIGNHSKSHRDLSGPADGESFDQYFTAVQQEINEAEGLIKRHLGVTPKYFAYPYGASNELLIAVLKKKGYRGGVKVAPGANPFYTDRFQVKRSVVYGDYDISRFAEELQTFAPQKLQ